MFLLHSPLVEVRTLLGESAVGALPLLDPKSLHESSFLCRHLVLTAELYRFLGPLVCGKTQLRPEKKQGIEPKSDFVS